MTCRKCHKLLTQFSTKSDPFGLRWSCQVCRIVYGSESPLDDMTNLEPGFTSIHEIPTSDGSSAAERPATTGETGVQVSTVTLAMSPQEFCYWLKGFLEGCVGVNQLPPRLQDVKVQLDKVLGGR